ncbi:hypothetical protein LTR09_012818 [Extremus antarcticus]|uniref:GED domain-containing protein n=1 Tax=Extremus antarcticus TaxID=702011 RepID=A0AAJ0D985_9PEZI|nr:hypothetical protein LTR09_012818 [Extremus antarcticus]
MRRSRGCELPGTFNPLVVGELFTEQFEPWKNLATTAKDQIGEATHNTVAAAINNITVLETTNGILQIIHRGLDKMKTDLERKTTELLEPYFTTHPITYNHYLTDTVQKAQSARRRRNFEQTLKELFGVDHLDNERYQVQPAHLLNLLDQRIEADMESYASNSAIDYMQAYYKVALKRFVDDFSVLAVEQCLVGRLPSLFTPEMVQKLSEEDVSGLASETEHTTAQRSQCLEKLAVLEEGLRDLKSLDKHRLILQDSDIERETNFGQPLLQRHRSITGLVYGGLDVVNGEDTNMASAPGSPLLAEVIVDPPEDVWPPTPSKKKKKAGHSTLGF